MNWDIVIIIAVFGLACRFINIILLYSLKSLLLLRKAKKIPKDNDRIVITGSTDGIGLAFAKYFAKAKENIQLILISRNETKLSNTKTEIIKLNNNIKVDTIVCDFSAGTLTPEIQKLPPIDLYIHCSGLSYPSALYLHEISDELINDMINVNFLMPLLLTNQQLNNVTNKESTVLYCGSAAATICEPLLAVYVATKASLATFTELLSASYFQKNFVFQCHTPFIVTTKMSKIKKPSLLVPSTEKYVKSAISCIRYASNKHFYNFFRPIITPYWSHKLIELFALYLIPPDLFNYFRLTSQKKIRSRYLKKQNVIN